MTKNCDNLKLNNKELEEAKDLLAKALEDLTDLERFPKPKYLKLITESKRFSEPKYLKLINDFHQLLENCSDILEEMIEQGKSVNHKIENDLEFSIKEIKNNPLYKGIKKIEQISIDDAGHALLDASVAVGDAVDKLNDLSSKIKENSPVKKLINSWESTILEHRKNQEKLHVK